MEIPRQVRKEAGRYAGVEIPLQIVVRQQAEPLQLRLMVA